MNKLQGIVSNFGQAIRLLRTLCVAALMLPALSALAQTASSTTLGASTLSAGAAAQPTVSLLLIHFQNCAI